MRGVRRATTVLMGGVAILLATACGGPDDVNVSKDLQTIRADVGGQVRYFAGDTPPLEGVTVTVTDRDGVQTTAATTADGLWLIVDLLPGNYDLSYALTGYQTIDASLVINAGGENDVGNIYLGQGVVSMQETGITATVSGALAATLAAGDVLRDGVAGTSAAISLAVGADIVVTTDLPLYAFSVFIQDEQGIVFGTADAARTTFTLTGLDMQALPLTDDTDSFTVDTLNVTGGSFTPIHGTPVQFQAQLQFNVDP